MPKNNNLTALTGGMSAALPKYEQIYQRIRDHIQSDRVADGDSLPSEPDLAKQFHVSRVTVRKALQMLENEGMVVRKGRVGTFATKRVVPLRPAASLEGLASEVEWLSEHSHLKVLGYERVAAPAPVRAALKLKPGTRIRRFSRLRYQDHGPIAYLQTYLTPAVERLVSKAELTSAPPLLVLLHKRAPLVRAHQIIAAEPADDRVAELLGVAPGAPLMRTSRILYDAQDRPVTLTIARMRADRFELHYTLTEEGIKRAPSVWRSDREGTTG